MDTITTNVFPNTKPYEPIAQYLLKTFNPTEEELDDFRRLVVYRDYSSKAYIVPCQGSVPLSVLDEPSIIVPRVTVKAQPTYWKRKKTINDNERLKSIAQNSVERMIDTEAIKVINAALRGSHTETVHQFDFEVSVLFKTFGIIEEHDLTVGAVLLHPMRFRQYYHKFEPYLTQNSILYKNNERSYRGDIDDVPVFTSTMCPKNAIYVVAESEYVGALVHYSDFIESEVELDSPHDEDTKEGVTITKTIGVAVINDYSVARIILS